MSNEYTDIRIDRKDGVAEVVLNRPDKLNAMAPSFFYEIKRAFEEIEDDDSIRAAIIWAEGRLFTAGLDLKSAGGLLTGGDATTRDGSEPSEATKNLKTYKTVRRLQDCFSALQVCRKPVIAAIHGKCIGGGLDLITAADIRMCTSDAEFSIFETRIAIIADVGTLQRITPIVGKGIAREMAFTGRFIGSERAVQSHLVNEVFPDKDSMLAGARALAREIAANSPLAVQGTKVVLNYSDEHSTDEGLEYVAQWNSSFLRSDDLTEAMTAFVEKRDPDFKGN
jgi:enoyl-CoA hydratase/carnithine racemase